MKTAIKDYFTFSQRDRRGIFWLLLILILLLVFRISQRWIPRYEKDYSVEIAALIESIEARRDSIRRLETQNPEISFERIEDRPEKSLVPIGSQAVSKPFPYEEESYSFFDPNALDLAGWMKLGFSAKQAQTIMNYKAKGGEFNKKEDVAKLYCVDEVKYEELEPWIRIVEDVEISRQINLNSADTSSLQDLRGIGSYYARKIVEYRQELGGYVDFEQLYEIWKMRPETVDLLRENCVIEPTQIDLLQVNLDSAEYLKQHPYVDWKLANAIVNYRTHHGSYHSWEDLREIQLLTPELEIKLKPYIGFDDRGEN